MSVLASLRSDGWTACPEQVDDFVGIRSKGANGLRNEQGSNVSTEEQRGHQHDQEYEEILDYPLHSLALHEEGPQYRLGCGTR